VKTSIAHPIAKAISFPAHRNKEPKKEENLFQRQFFQQLF
jgi:hypothetical protein